MSGNSAEVGEKCLLRRPEEAHTYTEMQNVQRRIKTHKTHEK